MKVIVLCNDKSLEGFENEHGLSILVEIGEEYYLFDTGSSDVAIRNAEKLNIDLSKITAIVISHAHYDHIGGLGEFLKKLENKTRVYIGPNAFLPKFSGERYAGPPNSKEEYEKLGAEFREVHKIISLNENIHILPKAPLVTWERPSKEFNILINDKKRSDFFDEELTMLITNDGSVSVITGCSHRGIGNIVLNVSKRWKVENLIGGLHLRDKGQSDIEKIIDIFKDLKIKRLLVGHCTGDNAIKIFMENRDVDVKEIMAGQIFEL
ncbi:MAG: MBL fold metallo-hydrolase [Thermotogae bacterium]|nr:MBL fold metallo-hydrolase [Thermotogota bacterium]